MTDLTRPTADQIEYAEARQFRPDALGYAHGLVADRAQRQNMLLGIPVVILTAITGTSAFASLADIGNTWKVFAFVTGILSVVAAVLAALQTFLDLGGKAAKHAEASTRLHSVSRAIGRMRRLNEDFSEMEKIDADYDDIMKTSPRVSIERQREAEEEIIKKGRLGDKRKPPQVTTER